MKAIERAAKAMFEHDWPRDTWERLGPGHHQDRYKGMVKAALPAFLDGILASPEARKRVISDALEGQGYNGPSLDTFVKALKQEAER